MRNIVISFILFIFIGTLSEAKTTLNLGFSDVDAPPFQRGNGTKLFSPPGISIEIIDEVAKNLDFEVKYKRYPNNRVLFFLENGQLDGAFIYSHKPQREFSGVYPKNGNSIDSSRRIATISYYFYTLKGSEVTWDGKTLSGKNLMVGANMGYSVISNLKKLGVRVVEAKTNEQNIEMLNLKRISAYAGQDSTIDPFLRMYKHDENIKKLSPAIITKPYYLLFSHQFFEKNEDLARKIWDEISKIRDPFTKSIEHKYINN